MPLSHPCPSLCLSTCPLSFCAPAILHSVCPPDLHPSVCPPAIQPSVYPSTHSLSRVSPSICLLSLYPSIIISQSMHQTSIFPSIRHLPPCNPYLSIHPSPPISTHPSVCHLSLCLPLHPFACSSHWSLGRPLTIHNPLASRGSKINSDHRKAVLTGTWAAQRATKPCTHGKSYLQSEAEGIVCLGCHSHVWQSQAGHHGHTMPDPSPPRVLLIGKAQSHLVSGFYLPPAAYGTSPCVG